MSRLSGRQGLGALLVSLAIGSAALASPGHDRQEDSPMAGAAAVQAFDAQLAVVARTDELLASKYQVRALELEHRVRAAYKLLRAGWAPLWIDAEQRRAAARRQAAVRRTLARTKAEMALLRQEVAVAARARAYLEHARRAAAFTRAPKPGSLQRPVAPGTMVAKFGVHRHQPSKARLSRRGIELASAKGNPVHAVAPGTVRYAGPIRGLGQGVIVAHDGFLSVSGHLAQLAVRAGDSLEHGAPVGHAAGERVVLEIRLDVGAGGYPVDPAPLLTSP